MAIKQVSFRVVCKVHNSVTCEYDDETVSLYDVKENIWDYAIDEHQMEMVDWDVKEQLYHD